MPLGALGKMPYQSMAVQGVRNLFSKGFVAVQKRCAIRWLTGEKWPVGSVDKLLINNCDR
jgi:hypothetical protein